MIPGRFAIAALLALTVGLVGFAPAQTPQPTPAVAKPAAVPTEFAVEKLADIPYRNGPDADERHKLDVYLPKGQKGFPVLFFVHGGSWKSGTKNLYAALGQAFAKLGIGVVIPNYRLSPKVVHPAHIQDVAGAFAWTCENIAKHGGKPDRIFAFGHSAGGHLVSLLATDPSYLKAEKHSPADIRGVISVSGVYRIYHTETFFHPMFGKSAEVCRNASPIQHVTGKHPPFLIAYADNDYEHLDTLAIEMNSALLKSQCSSRLLKVKNRNHITIIMNVIQPEDALNQALRTFVTTNGK